MLWKIAIGVLVLTAVIYGVGYAAGTGWFGEHEGPGAPQAAERPRASVAAGAAAVRDAAAGLGVSRPKQILFGDLHVHTTFSLDAFLFSLPFLQGEGAHPPADACDFARYCAGVDFWSINDHAFSITPRHWRETVEAIRQCNDVAGDPANPDTVAFLGWEWTQVGTRPENHYGHKNVILAHTDEDRIPSRPIAALRGGGIGDPRIFGRGLLALASGEERLHDMNRYFAELEATDRCPEDVPVRELPDDCIEGAATPAELFHKLDDWGHDAIVIPHGTTWGFYTPPGSSWDKQLAGAMHDPERQSLVEVYSGHGDSEVHRDWRAVVFDADGRPRCPAPSDDYLPSCWRAGEIIRERCLALEESDAECEQRAVTARAHAAAAGVAILRSIPGTRATDWLVAGQCTDCLEPAFNYRPGNSAQYMVAIGGFDDSLDAPRRFRPGFIASSDNHFARPGTGYKEVHRRGMTESLAGAASQQDGPVADLLQPPVEEPTARSHPFELDQPGFAYFETERQGSFLTTGGLVAVHADGRDRASIWDAMQRREVYGTSGPRILLWFDLLNPPGTGGGTLPMGSEVAMATEPIFQVRAAGSFEQKPGCPEDSLRALDPERLEHLCKGECYHPGDRRRPLSRIEIVRIRPQQHPDEDVSALIDDPWRVFGCDGDPAGCAVTFTDPEFRAAGREALYYARVFEAPKPGINGANLRCERDAEGRCTRVHPCAAEGDDPFDDCLAEIEPRAWSSPIYADFPAGP